MKRNAVKIGESPDGSIEIFVDAQNADKILRYICKDEKHRNKAHQIFRVIYERLNVRNVYD